jgi:heme exporter protein B
MGTAASAWVDETAAVVRKDTLSELRTKVSLSAVLLFAVTALALVSFSTGTLIGVPPTLRATLKAALLYIVLFFSAMSGLDRVFVKEEDARTVAALRLAARPSVVFAGKLIVNVLALTTVGALVVPLFVLLLDPGVARWDLFIATAVVSVVGLAGAATIVAAIVAKASARGSLFAVLGFPLLLPILISAVNATRGAMLGGDRVSESGTFLVVLVCYAVAMISASFMLFPYVWEE